MESWYRKHLEEEYGMEYMRRLDEAEVRMAEEGPSAGPTGECPECNGPLVYLFEKDVHYCAMCDIKYEDVDAYGRPVVQR